MQENFLCFDKTERKKRVAFDKTETNQCIKYDKTERNNPCTKLVQHLMERGLQCTASIAARPVLNRDYTMGRLMPQIFW